MKIYLETEEDGAEGKEIVFKAELQDIKDAKKVVGKRTFVHHHYHDDAIVRPCKREELK